jgi:Leucine-rich repeat (LRR) protein
LTKNNDKRNNDHLQSHRQEEEARSIIFQTILKMANDTETIAATLVPGKTRIRDTDGFVATVRYVGPVASAKKTEEIYAGVEWDDATRGKHDGSVISRKTNEIVRHFSLKYPSLTGGSFLRLKTVDVGVELSLKLIQSRYVDEAAPLVAPNNMLPFFARTSSGRDKPIEFLGEMKVRKRQQLEDLDDISLRGMGISKGAYGEERELLTNTFQHLRELDVAGNLFSGWDDLFAVLLTFPHLTWFSFASNKIQDIPPQMEVREGGFEKLRVLNLNKCSIDSFRTVEMLDKICPNLEELCVAFNNLSDMNEGGEDADGVPLPVEPLNGFRHLVHMDFSACNISSWSSQVHRLAHLPKLQALMLDDNPLTDSIIDKSTSEFQALENLQIAGTAIDSWAGIQSLSHLPNLKNIRFRKCPLTDVIGSGEVRAGTIARLPLIQILCASKITVKERLEAEKRYVSNVSREMLQLTKNVNGSSSNEDGNEFSAIEAFKKLGLDEKYPRFAELVTKHKEAMIVSNSGMGGGTISQNALNVTITSMAAESCTNEPLVRRLPASLKISRLKTMCARAFGLDVDLQILHFRSEVRETRCN